MRKPSVDKSLNNPLTIAARTGDLAGMKIYFDGDKPIGFEIPPLPPYLERARSESEQHHLFPYFPSAQIPRWACFEFYTSKRKTKRKLIIRLIRFLAVEKISKTRRGRSGDIYEMAYDALCRIDPKQLCELHGVARSAQAIKRTYLAFKKSTLCNKYPDLDTLLQELPLIVYGLDHLLREHNRRAYRQFLNYSRQPIPRTGHFSLKKNQ